MTDQTIPVPVAELQRLRDWYPTLASQEMDGPIKNLTALIPDPPKVGDHPTAEQAFTLPVRSTFVDNDGDTYVVYGTGKIRRATNYFLSDADAWEEWEATVSGLQHTDLTITFIPARD